MSAPRRTRRTLVLLAAVFFGPLLAAFYLYYGSDWRPTGHTNHGTLIQPPRALESALFLGKWSLVYVGTGSCDADCRKTLHFMRQTHLGLGRMYTRVQGVFLATAPCCDRSYLEREYPQLHTVDIGAGHSEALLNGFPSTGRATAIFIVDPRGYLMMRYDSSASPEGLLADLRQLLAPLSAVG